MNDKHTSPAEILRQICNILILCGFMVVGALVGIFVGAVFSVATLGGGAGAGTGFAWFGVAVGAALAIRRCWLK